MITKISNICLFVILFVTLVMIGSMITGFQLEPASRPITVHIVMWSFGSIVTLCALLMLSLSLEPMPELETEDAADGDIDGEMDGDMDEIVGAGDFEEEDEFGSDVALADNA